MAMTEDRAHTLVISGDAGVKVAAEVASSLATAIDQFDRIAVDTQTVSTADVTTIQTLLSARATARARGKDLSLLAPLGEALSPVLAQAGFLSPEQEHVGFWSPLKDKPAGH